MNKKIRNICTALIISWFTAASCMDAAAEMSVYIEGAFAFPSYSDISIPRSDENEFSLTDDLEAEGAPAFRTEVRYSFNDIHRIELLAAPLSITADGVLVKDIVFNKKLFLKGEAVEGLFRFDSYRLRYRYFFRNTGYFRSAGFTAKIRDAEISLESPSKKTRKLNTGFVPLLNFILSFPIREGLSLDVDGDALFSPYGRAEDILVSLKYRVNPELALNCGYRVVEGGSDVEEVYSFTWINYLLAGIEYRL
ncbi:MAG: hypothetical protein JXJ19_04930 [Elusimicrobia bacterium]|nr:hypothetical protein [Elusimicrobiota bacterium]